jgi:hypothetical protein
MGTQSVKEEEKGEVEGAKARAVNSRGETRHDESELRSYHPHTAQDNLGLTSWMITTAAVVWDYNVSQDSNFLY